MDVLVVVAAVLVLVGVLVLGVVVLVVLMVVIASQARPASVLPVPTEGCILLSHGLPRFFFSFSGHVLV